MTGAPIRRSSTSDAAHLPLRYRVIEDESIDCLDSAAPNRLGFDLLRVMRTPYRIGDFRATRRDFTPYYAALAVLADLAPDPVLPTDMVIHRGHPP